MTTRIGFGVMAAVLLVGLGAGCSSDKGASDGDKACQDLQSKYAECQLQFPANGVCNTAEPCTVECAAHASCDQLKAGTPSGSYLSCVAACNGAGPTDFICKDASGYVHAAGVCDGIAQCPDRSDEASCGGDAGAGGAATSGGTGGASGATATGGNGNDSGGSAGSGGSSGGANLDGGSAPVASAECKAFVAHELSQCPSYSSDSELTKCARLTAEYGPVGCLAEWNAFIICEAKTPIASCTDGPTGCDAEQSEYFSCNSRFAQKTACTRLDRDLLCTADKPYLFGCLSTIPSNCKALPATGGGPEACCSQFAPP